MNYYSDIKYFPIENVFHVGKVTLKKEAVEQKISKESFLQFKERVIKHLKNCNIITIDRPLPCYLLG